MIAKYLIAVRNGVPTPIIASPSTSTEWCYAESRYEIVKKAIMGAGDVTWEDGKPDSLRCFGEGQFSNFVVKSREAVVRNCS